MPKRANWSIRTKIISGYVVIILCVGVVLLMMSGRVNQLEQENRYINDHDLEVHNLTNLIEKHVLDMETGQRGFALTGDDSYLVPYNNGVLQWEADYNKLVTLVEDNELQRSNLGTIKTGIEKWIQDAGDPVLSMRRSNDQAGIAQFFKVDPGKQQIDRLRSELEAFRVTEKALTDARIESIAASNERLFIAMVTLWIVVAIVSLITAWVIARQIVRTLRDVTDTIHDIGEGGDLNKRITIRTRDEIAELGTATNQLLDHVQHENWIKDQIAIASTRFQESDRIETLSSALLTKMNKWFSASYGVVYYDSENEEEGWVKSASFAAHNRDIELGAAYITEGEGLAGQCIVEKRMLTYSPLPKGYVQITSGLGNTEAKALVAAPIMFENKVLAVVEIAFIEPMTLEQSDLFEHLLNIFAVTMNSLLIRKKIEQMYRDSQNMNYELQVQSEELQVQSEELQTQADELHMQTEELQMLNERLEQGKMAAESTAIELDKYAQQLQVSSRYKSEFLANMSHELRTPLNSMLILSQILSENSANTLTEKEQEYASIIHHSGKDLLNLINDILDLSKVEAGKMHIEIDPVSTQAIPEQMERYFKEGAALRELYFNIEVKENVPDLIYSDDMRLQQVLRNLLSNAFKFTEVGGVTLTIEKLDRVQTQEYQSDQPMIAFTVRDTGIGISPENSRLIFEAFRQADGATARKYGGTGLGLSISSQLAHLLGGEITLESKVGEGSTFTFYIPCLESDPNDESELFTVQQPISHTVFFDKEQLHSIDTELETNTNTSIQSSRVTASYSEIDRISAVSNEQVIEVGQQVMTEEQYEGLDGKKILIVDDDIRNVYALTSLLERHSVNILISQNGRDALEILHMTQDIDLILMDIMMPQLDGYETMRTIRNLYGYAQVPIIVLTAKAMKEDREKAIQAGASDYMSKPLEMQQVLLRIEHWLGKTQTQYFTT